MIIYTVPYAGGNTSMYYELKKSLAERKISLINLELAGHGSRYCESLMDNISDIAKDIYNQLIMKNLEENFSLLGYSMGSIIIYEVYFMLKKNNYPLPCYMFLCACVTPEIMGSHKQKKVTDSEIVELLVSFDGTPKEVITNQEMLNYIMPIVKADFSAIFNYVHLKKTMIEAKGIIVYSDNEISSIQEWNNYFEKECLYYYMEGGHFFIHNKSAELAQIIWQNLKE